LQEDFINGTALSAFVASISFSCLLQTINFDGGAFVEELKWLEKICKAGNFNQTMFGGKLNILVQLVCDFAHALPFDIHVIVFLGKVIFPGAFMLAIFETMRCVFASLYKHMMFLIPSPEHTIHTMEHFLLEPEFAKRRWWHLSPVFDGIKYNVLGACVGVLFHYGFFPSIVPFGVLIALHVNFKEMKKEFDHAMINTFKEFAHGWKDADDDASAGAGTGDGAGARPRRSPAPNRKSGAAAESAAGGARHRKVSRSRSPRW
jgi:hypothetical protein